MTPADAAALAEIQRRSYRHAGSGLRSSWPEADALDEHRPQAFLDRTR